MCLLPPMNLPWHLMGRTATVTMKTPRNWNLDRFSTPEPGPEPKPDPTWARPAKSGRAQDFLKPKPAKTRPKPGLARPDPTRPSLTATDAPSLCELGFWAITLETVPASRIVMHVSELTREWLRRYAYDCIVAEVLRVWDAAVVAQACGNSILCLLTGLIGLPKSLNKAVVDISVDAMSVRLSIATANIWDGSALALYALTRDSVLALKIRPGERSSMRCLCSKAECGVWAMKLETGPE
ncbi:hypothetical protein DFH09DRAFT_1085025 [Mycena vulgaris]|nr:hypothetical protein DFH09DRAFT_1085025 [Mycena vulgaris]